MLAGCHSTSEHFLCYIFSLIFTLQWKCVYANAKTLEHSIGSIFFGHRSHAYVHSLTAIAATTLLNQQGVLVGSDWLGAPGL